MTEDATAIDDLAFTRAIVRHACEAGADHAQALTSVTSKVEVVCGPLNSATMREISARKSSLLIIVGGRIGSVNFSDATGHSAADAVAEAMRKAAIASPVNGLRLAEGAATASSDYGPRMADSGQLVDLAIDYTETMRRDHPAIITRESSVHHSLVRTTFYNSNRVARQETRGIHGFTTLFAARDRGRPTAFSSYGVSALAAFERIIDQGDQRRRYEDALAGLSARTLDAKFIGTIIVAPEALGFIVAPLLKDITVSAESDPGLLSGDREEIAARAFSLANRPHGPDIAMGRDFDGFGVTNQNIDVIVAGRLQAPLVDFMTASRHGLQQNFGWTSVVVKAGQASLKELIEATDRGIIFSNFAGSTHRGMEFSGAARNSFYIESGKIVCALDNVMVSGNLRRLLQNVSGVSKETVHSGTAVFPYLAATGVTIQSGTGQCNCRRGS
jgi:PmbA protein